MIRFILIVLIISIAACRTDRIACPDFDSKKTKKIKIQFKSKNTKRTDRRFVIRYSPEKEFDNSIRANSRQFYEGSLHKGYVIPYLRKPDTNYVLKAGIGIPIKSASKQVFENDDTQSKSTLKTPGDPKTKKRNSPLAIVGFVTAILAIIFSALGLRQINEYPEKWRGKALARVGLIMGIVSLCLGILILGFFWNFSGFN